MYMHVISENTSGQLTHYYKVTYLARRPMPEYASNSNLFSYTRIKNVSRHCMLKVQAHDKATSTYNIHVHECM